MFSQKKILLLAALWLVAICLLSQSIYAQAVISNTGAAISVQSAVVDADTVNNISGKVQNNGTINLSGSYINRDRTEGDGTYNIGGNWLNTSSFIPGMSTVRFRGTKNQSLYSTGGGTFYKLHVNNGGPNPSNRILLNNDFEVNKELEFSKGNVVTGSNVLYLSNKRANSLVYNSIDSSRIIGYFERGINEANNYLFPIGSDTLRNQFHLIFNEVPTEGSIVSRFVQPNLASNGLPIEDDSVEIFKQYPEGYWDLTANNGFASSNFDVSLDAVGFDSLQEITRVIRRDGAGDWEVDGTHEDLSGTVANRQTLSNGISSSGTIFGLGRPRPRITEQPQNDTVCDGFDAYFIVGARGRSLEYQWQVWDDGDADWKSLAEGDPYYNVQTKELRISPATLAMDGTRYRVVITDRYGNVNVSDPAILVVNPIPQAFAFPSRDTICDGDQIDIELDSDVEGTSFRIEIVDANGITGASTNLFQDSLMNHQLANTGLSIDSVIYRIIPYGPEPTECEGEATYVVILVNPTPRHLVSVSNSLISSDTVFCNGYTLDFNWDSITQETSGQMKYHLYIYGDDAEVDGESPLGNRDSLKTGFSNTLTHLEDSIQTLYYDFQPYIENAHGNVSCFAPVERSQDTTIAIQVVPVFKSEYFVDTLLGGYNVTCFGDSDGSVGLKPLGGYYREDYSFLWKDSMDAELQDAVNMTDTLRGLSAGMYYYELEDILGCKHDSLFDVIEPDIVQLIDTTFIQPLCYNPSLKGTIEVTVGGGVPEYSYSWKNLNTLMTLDSADRISNISPGEWRVTYSDIHGCGSADKLILTAPSSFAGHKGDTSSFGVFDISCHGADDASVRIYGTGGTPPYTYTWYDQDSVEITSWAGAEYLEDLTPGTYYFQVIDDHGCRMDDIDTLTRYTVTEPDPISFRREESDRYLGDWDVSCFGLSDGRISLDYRGGHTHDFELENDFSWTGDHSFESSDSILSGLSAGTYHVQYYDYVFEDSSKFCTHDTTIVLKEPIEISYRDSSKAWIGDSSIRCFGEANGEAFILGMYGGGTKADTGDTPSEFSYEWMPLNGHVLDDIGLKDQTGLTAGWYKYRIIDNVNPLCYKEDSIRLSQPAILRADTLIDRAGDKNGYAIRCYGYDDGQISLIPDGGTTPYRYSWSDGGGVIGSGSDIGGLSAELYSVVLTDTNGCEVTYDFDLNSPDTIVLNENEDFIECYGDTSSIYLYPSGGYLHDESDYTYEWEDASTEFKFNAQSGTYFVSVTDDNNCEVSDSLTLIESAEILTDISIGSSYNGMSITCNEAADGVMDVDIEGGNPGYSYEWYHSGASDLLSNGSQVTGLAAGVYVVTGMDQYGCVYRDSLEIDDPDAIQIDEYIIRPNCHGATDGSIELYVRYGTPGYTYQWMGPEVEMDGSQIESLSEGDYSVIVKDMNNCIAEKNFSLIAPEALWMISSSEPAECPDENNGLIRFDDPVGGTFPYTKMVNDDEVNINPYDYLSPGLYYIHLTDANGCYFKDTIEVETVNESCLDLPNAFTPNGDGQNDTWVLDFDEDGSNDMYLYPDAELSIFNRWGEMIYFSDNVADEPWDGTYRGRDLPLDSYHYILDLGNDDPPISGTVTIIR